METIKTYENKDYKLQVGYDCDYTDSPLGWGWCGTFVLFHSRYNIGHKHNYQATRNLKKELEKEYAYVVSISAYEHSGMSLYVGNHQVCRWDSGQVGYYVMTKDEVEEIGADNISSYLDGYLNTYNQYLNGEIMGYTLEKMVYNPKTNRMENQFIDGLCGIYDDIISDKELLKSCLIDNCNIDIKEIESLLQ